MKVRILQKIVDLYEAKGELHKALSYSRELKTCLEEHLNDKSLKKIEGLQLQLETEKKEKEAARKSGMITETEKHEPCKSRNTLHVLQV